MEHAISRDSLERFAAGAATREEGRTIALHLLKGCVTCAATLRTLHREKPPMDAYGLSLDRFDRGLRAEVQAPSGMLTVLRAVLKETEPRLEEMLARR
ncbi:MAG TPA: hypothetical protein VNM67_24610 [Thermoanaerobaculia bacterium]|nr:hypothetical protein [Thermoanaerobaculia bacterium]